MGKGGILTIDDAQHLVGRPVLIGDDLRAAPADRGSFLAEPPAAGPNRAFGQLPGHFLQDGNAAHRQLACAASEMRAGRTTAGGRETKDLARRDRPRQAENFFRHLQRRLGRHDAGGARRSRHDADKHRLTFAPWRARAQLRSGLGLNRLPCSGHRSAISRLAA